MQPLFGTAKMLVCTLYMFGRQMEMQNLKKSIVCIHIKMMTIMDSS